MKMRKFATLIVTTAIGLSMIAGCGKQITESDPGATATTQAVIDVTGTSETAPAETTTQDLPGTFDELYGNQLKDYLNHQYYFNGEPVPVQESNYYFINAFIDLSNYANMGYYPATNLNYLDLAAECTSPEYATYGDYFISYAEGQLQSACLVCKRADEAGVELSDETKQKVDDMFKNIQKDADEHGMSLNDYLSLWYGEGSTEETFRKVVERYLLVDAYTEDYCTSYVLTEEDKTMHSVRYALFYAPESAEKSEKEKAYAAAAEMKNSCKSIDDITALAEAAKEEKIVYDQGDIDVYKNLTVRKFEDWAFAKERTVGEMDIIYAPEYGYFLVGYLGSKDYEVADVGDFAAKMLNRELQEEISKNLYDFHTDTEFAPAQADTSTPAQTEQNGTADSAESTAATFDPDTSFVSESNASGANSNGASGSMNTADVLIVVFFTLAGVAIAAVIVILINYAIKNNKLYGSDSSKKASKSYDDLDDEEPGDEEKSPDSKKNKKTKKAEPVEEEDPAEDEESEEENDGEDEDADEEEDAGEEE